jgi:glucokinase
MPSHIVVISGLPGSGKTTMAERLRDSLRWPLLAKDEFKERLFDVFGSADVQSSKQLSLASYAQMFDRARQLVEAQTNFIMEGNFRWHETGRDFESLYERARWTQVWCTAPPALIADRLRRRARTGSRHPVHRDAENLTRMIAELTQAQTPLPLPGEVLVVDSSAATDESLTQVLARIAG